MTDFLFQLGKRMDDGNTSPQVRDAARFGLATLLLNGDDRDMQRAESLGQRSWALGDLLEEIRIEDEASYV